MSDKASMRTDDWHIEIVANVEVSLGLTIGCQLWHFHSPRLDYACKCYVPRGGVGLSIGAELPFELDERMSGAIPSFDQQHITIERSFSANQLDGATTGSLSFGARGVVAGAEGTQLNVKDAMTRVLFRIHGGSVSVGLGVGVNMGTISIGTFYGPYEFPTRLARKRARRRRRH